MRIFRITMLLLFAVKIILGQDLHFSQAFNSPLSTNPANTGFIPDADYRIGAQFRNQYSSILANPYKTTSVYGDFQIGRDELNTGWFGLGGIILQDAAGAGNLKSTKVYLSAAYHKFLGNSSLLSAGANIGYASKSIDITNLKFPDQFDGKFFDKNLPTSVQLNSNNSQYLDMQVGMNFAYYPTENVYYNIGISAHHINRPKETFFIYEINDDIYGQRIPIRYIGFLNGIVKVNDRLIANPFVFFTSQAKTSNLVLGSTANYNLSEFGEKQLIFGLHYRLKGSVIPMAGFELGDFKLLYSFDATINNINSFSNYKGAHEISLTKRGFYKGKTREWNCPSFKNTF